MGWMVTVVVGITIQSALVKWLGETLSSVQILWLRGAVGLFFVLPIFAFRQVRFYSHGLKRHFLRALAGVLSMACWFYALTELPLAEATSYSFAMPLFLTVLAWAFLGEKLKWQTWLATVIGFSGVLIIMRPDSVTLGLAALAGLAAAFLHAVAAILIKTLASSESALALLLYFPVLAIVVFLFPAMSVWISPTPTEWVGLVGVAALGVQTQWGFIQACRISDMTFLAPLDYSRLLFALVLGYLLFSELPDFWTLAGAAVVVGSTLYVVKRDHLL
jgi:drug/metabolite transporter (DMT)-like permease|tara:strand:- start:200 stop:1024 length:825 start_codon:yes stop_codon:yes gene_type:complete